jgi:hypothetical protein
MRGLLSGLGVLAVLACLAGSMSMNYLYGVSLGRTELESGVWGGLSIAFDALKACAPIYLVGAWRKREWARVVAGLIIVPGVIVYGLLSAVGFASESKGAVLGGREAVRAAYVDAERELKEQTLKRAALKTYRVAGEIEAAIAAVLARPVSVGERTRGTVGTLSSGCGRDDARAREACAEVATLRQELATAVEAGRLETRIAALRRQVGTLRERGAAIDPNPQATLLSRLTLGRVSPADVEGFKSIYVALLVEVVSTFGLLFVIERNELRRALVEGRDKMLTVPTSAVSEGVPGRFVRECLEAADGERVELGALHPAYAGWCGRLKLAALDVERFVAALEAGFASTDARMIRDAGKVYVHGVRLVA